MKCPSVNDCSCPKVECANHKRCCDCIVRHRSTDSLPYCLFPAENKKVENYYHTLKERFEKE